MKDYKIKEALTNLKQSFDAWKAKTEEVGEKFEVLVEVLSEKEEQEKEAEEGVLNEV